jgi:hypothetical protein
LSSLFELKIEGGRSIRFGKEGNIEASLIGFVFKQKRGIIFFNL